MCPDGVVAYHESLSSFRPGFESRSGRYLACEPKGAWQESETDFAGPSKIFFVRFSYRSLLIGHSLKCFDMDLDSFRLAKEEIYINPKITSYCMNRSFIKFEN